MKPLFSIIIPSLNEEQFIPKLLLDLTKQKVQNFEVVVVDGKSEDRTKTLVTGFKKKLPLSFVEVAKRNVSHQRNYGGEVAKGSFLIFLDADLRVAPSFTQKLEKLITAKKGLIFLPTMMPDERKPETIAVFRVSNKIVEASQNIGRPIPSPGALIIEKNLFKKIHGYDEKMTLAEDHDILKRAQDWGIKAKFLEGLNVKFSLRRAKKEGRLTTLYKYALSTSHILFTGKLKEKIFEYEMGGGTYHLSKGKKEDDAQVYLKKIKDFFVP